MKNYREIYNNAILGYKADKEEGAYNILSKLSKTELLELNNQLKITILKTSDTKNNIINNIIFFGIKWDIESEAIRTVNMK